MHDEENYRYITSNGKVIYLTKIENKVLRILINNKNRIVKIEEICKEVYDLELDYSFSNVIRQKVSKLRKKLKGQVKIINRHGIGYEIK